METDQRRSSGGKPGKNEKGNGGKEGSEEEDEGGQRDKKRETDGKHSASCFGKKKGDFSM